MIKNNYKSPEENCDIRDLKSNVDSEEYIKENKSKKLIHDRKIIKIVLVIILLILLACFNNIQTSAFKKEPECLYDATFDLTNGIAKILKDNVGLKNAILIIGGLLEDIAVLLGFGFFCFYFKSWRMLFALGKIYAIRGIVQALFILRIPKDNLFAYPGFPSLFVPYLNTNDYYFSGHVSLPSIIAHEFYKDKKYYYLAYFCYFTALYETFMMTVVRGHYGIDLFAGFIFSFYVCRLTDLYIDVIDKSKIGLFYKEESEINQDPRDLSNNIIKDNINDNNNNS